MDIRIQQKASNNLFQCKNKKFIIIQLILEPFLWKMCLLIVSTVFSALSLSPIATVIPSLGKAVFDILCILAIIAQISKNRPVFFVHGRWHPGRTRWCRLIRPSCLWYLWCPVVHDECSVMLIVTSVSSLTSLMSWCSWWMFCDANHYVCLVSDVFDVLMFMMKVPWCQ